MGLDTSHDCWHGPYGSFSRWRTELARVAGYKVTDEVEPGHPRYELPWEMFEDKNYQGEWDSPPGDDPLLFLLVHSDCDGVIRPAQGIHIAARLEQLAPQLGEEWHRQRAMEFADGLRKAAASGEDVDFH